jgi:hypothetical protein
MSRTASRQGTKSLRKNGRTESRKRRRETQRLWWLQNVALDDGLDLPKNLRQRWARRGQLGGAS